ncbi:hypothetical protein D3C77_584380 [compost metagenome]
MWRVGGNYKLHWPRTAAIQLLLERALDQVQLSDEDLLHLRMQMGFRLFNEDEVYACGCRRSLELSEEFQ